MKGLYFINTDVENKRAHTAQILNTVSELSKKLDIEIAAPRYRKSLDKEVLKKTHDLENLPKINLLRNFGLAPGLASFLAFNIPAALFLIRKRPDYIYIRSNHFFLLAMVAKLLRIEYFYETHRVPLSVTEKFRDAILAQFSLGIIVISAHVRKHYEKYGKKILVVHDAVSLKRFSIQASKETLRSEFRLPPEDKIVTYTGTISKLKGIDYLIDAAELLPDVMFLLIGSISNEFNISSWPLNVRTLGFMEQGKLPSFLKISDALILPHPDNEYSQSPMKLFEYMASGVPIVSTNLASLSEVLNERNSVLVRPNNPEALKAGILKAFSSAHLGEKAKVDILEYTWEKRGQKIANFIKQCKG